MWIALGHHVGAGLAIAALLLAQAAGGERVTVTSSDGAELAARFLGAGRDAPGVLFFPMCSAGATGGWAPVAERLQSLGVSSLMVSYRGDRGTRGSDTGDRRGADADASLALLRSRIGATAPVAFAGASCGVALALQTAAAHPAGARAVAVLSGPYSPAQIDHVRHTPALAVFSGASAGEPPSPDWARALAEASAHPASRWAIAEQRGHGTDLFPMRPDLAVEIAEWLAARLKDAPPR